MIRKSRVQIELWLLFIFSELNLLKLYYFYPKLHIYHLFDCIMLSIIIQLFSADLIWETILSHLNLNSFYVLRVKCPYCPVEQLPSDAKQVFFWTNYVWEQIVFIASCDSGYLVTDSPVNGAKFPVIWQVKGSQRLSQHTLHQSAVRDFISNQMIDWLYWPIRMLYL